MSEIISFRLNPNNPREARALEILAVRQDEGFGIRQVLVEALLMLGEEQGSAHVPVVSDLQAVLAEARSLVCELRNGDAPLVSRPSQSTSSEGKLSDGFLVSVKKAARPGMKSG